MPWPGRGFLNQSRNWAVESTWSSCLPLGKTVISWRYSASQGAFSGMWTKPFSIISRRRRAIRSRISDGERVKTYARHLDHDRTVRPGSGRGIRRDRHRRRDFRHVYALPPARTGHDRAGLRGRHERRRHLVLEPLSRRALRFRKLDLWLLLLQGADGGMGLEGAFLPPARHARIPELRRLQVRPAPGH